MRSVNQYRDQKRIQNPRVGRMDKGARGPSKGRVGKQATQFVQQGFQLVHLWIDSGSRQNGESGSNMSINLGMYTGEEACHAFLKLEAEVCHAGVNVLESEYLGNRFNQVKVDMELLDYFKQIKNVSSFSRPKLDELAYN